MYDLIIIGAGPAGMAAAATAAAGGLRVLLLDDQPRAGGQIYRNVTANAPTWLGKDYAAGLTLIAGLDHPDITTEFGATVWRIESDPSPRILWSQNGTSRISTAPHLLLATGAQERPMPFPGWTLPGVMSAGAAQILMKTAGLLPRDAVLAGSGPLLYLLAAQMIDAGAPPIALVETQTPAMQLCALPHLPRALLSAPMLLKGLGLLRKIRASGVPRHTAAHQFRAVQTDAGTIRFSFAVKGRSHQLETPLLLTHQGVIPATHISRAAGISQHWNQVQQTMQPMVSPWGRTNQPHIHLAGDGASIAGAEAAQASGRLAALDILHLCGKLSEDARSQRAAPDHAARIRARAIRPYLDRAYAPAPEFLAPQGETIICRCEEITADQIRQSLTEGANGPRQVKTATRAGMGPCQGRMCEAPTRGILAECGVNHDPARARSPIKPILLGELAALAQSSNSQPSG